MKRAMIRVCGFVLVSMLTLGAGLAVRAATPTPSGGNERAQLLWYTLGLRELEKGKDASVRLTKAQARKILPILEQLAAHNLFVTKIPDGRGQTSGAQSAGTQGGAAQGAWGGQVTDEQRAKLQKQRQQVAEEIAKALAAMDKILRRDQLSVIDNLDFDAAQFGIADFQGARANSGTAGNVTQEQRAALRQKMAAGMRKMVALNNEVMTLVRKKAGK